MTTIRLSIFNLLFFGLFFGYSLFLHGRPDGPPPLLAWALILIFGASFAVFLRFTLLPAWGFDGNGVYRFGLFTLQPQQSYNWNQVTKIGIENFYGRSMTLHYFTLSLNDPKLKNLRFSGLFGVNSKDLGEVVRLAREVNPKIEIDPRVLAKIQDPYLTLASFGDLAFGIVVPVLLSLISLILFVSKKTGTVYSYGPGAWGFLAFALFMMLPAGWFLFLMAYKWRHRWDVPAERAKAPAVKKASLPAPSLEPKPGPLYVTYALLISLTGLFAAETHFAFGPLGKGLAPSLHSIIAFGASNPRLASLPGGWTRLFTSTLLHADDMHLLYNLIALYLAGWALEKMVGGAWFFNIYFLSGLSGSLASLFFAKAHTVTLGASGAIMGIMGAALVVAFRLPKGGYRSLILRRIGPGFVLSLWPQVASHGQQVDLSAHFGGALCGTLMALLLFETWKKEEPLPGWEAVAKLLALAGAGVLLWSASVPPRAYAHNRDLEARLAPESQLPKPYDKAVAQSRTLLAQYPNDPRVLAYRATAYWRAGNLAGCEGELKKALAEKETLDLFYEPQFVRGLELELAETLLRRGRRAEAKEAAKPLCEGQPEATIAERLKKLRLCE